MYVVIVVNQYSVIVLNACRYKKDAIEIAADYNKDGYGITYPQVFNITLKKITEIDY